MKALRRIVSVVLFLTLLSVQLAGVAHAQYGNSGGGRGGKTQEPAEEADYDYVADSQNEWTAEYGEEDGSGNWYYYHNPLYDAAHETELGWADGYCIQTVADAYQYCTWSLYTDSWTLSAHGVLDQSTGDNWYAIAGGTGDYADVHGYLAWSASEDGSQYYYTVQEQEYAAYDPLRVEAGTENWHATYWYDPSYSYSNVWYWHDPLYAEDSTTEIGWIDGYCIRTAPNASSECDWTIAGDGWSITASGRKYDEDVSWLTITSGWGEYEGATGTVAWDSSDDGKNWYDYHFDYLPTTLAKPYEVYMEGGPGFLYADLVEPEKADGDTYYWHSNLWDANQEYKVGWTDGYCVITAPEEYSVCTVTLYNDYWTLTVSGPSYETSDPSVFAVTGGTGAYADVSGTVTVTPNEDYSWFDFTFDLYVAPYTYWQSVGWDQVTEEEAGYWYTLGWNEYNWDGSRPAAVPDSEVRTWAELTPYEQEAATALGYDETTWNPTAPRKPDGDPDTYWNGYDWEDLYLSEKHLWAILGWNEYNWSGVPEAAMPTSEWRTWTELKPVEQGAAAWLGYDETTWNVHVVRTPEGDPEEYWSQYAWDELHYSEQELFGYLGWNADAWAGDQPIPESKYRTWEQLNHVEKGAASQLGYDAENWDAKVLTH
jgi:hypothetical protein